MRKVDRKDRCADCSFHVTTTVKITISQSFWVTVPWPPTIEYKGKKLVIFKLLQLWFQNWTQKRKDHPHKAFTRFSKIRVYISVAVTSRAFYCLRQPKLFDICTKFLTTTASCTNLFIFTILVTYFTFLLHQCLFDFWFMTMCIE